MIKISSAVPSSNESEKYVENFLNKKLSNDFECYIQHWIGDTNRADFVILNAKTQICVVIEIKHYNLHNNSLDEHKRIYLSAKSQIKTSQIKSLSKLAKIDTNKIISCLLFYKATTEFARSICDENDDFKDSVFGDDEEFDNFINNLAKPQQSKVLSQMELSAIKEILTEHKKEYGVKIKFTKEQEKYIKPSAKTWQRVRGVAGSGKTLVICERAARLASNKKDVLIICHNRTLKNHLRWYLERSYKDFSRKNIEIFHFDNFLVNFLKENEIKENQIPKGEPYEDRLKFLISKAKEFLDNGINQVDRKYDAILIDEAQDLQKECFEILIKFLTKNDEILIVADERQNVHKRDLSWLDDKSYKFTSEWGNLERQNLRQQKFPGIILKANEFAKEFFKDTIFSEDEIKEQKERLDFARLLWCDYAPSYLNDDVWVEQDVFLAYNFLLNQGFENKDITILVTRTNDGKEIVKYFEEQKVDVIHTLDSYAKDEFSLTVDAVKVSTVESFKGLESKAIILVHYPRKEDNDKLLFVALTRATEFFIVFNCVEEHKKFGKGWEEFYKNLEKFYKN